MSFSRWIKNRLYRSTKRRPSRRRQNNRRRMFLEALEDRRLLTTNVEIAGATGDVLTITDAGLADADNLRISHSGSS